MKTSLEEINSVKKKLVVEIESDEVDKKINEAYKELKKTTKLPGFRQGKVPRKILERHFGAKVVEDLTQTLINETLPTAIDEVKTFPVGMPLLEKEELKPGHDFKYSAVMDVLPQFELKDYLGIEIEKEKAIVSEKEVQDKLEQLRKTRAKLASVEENRAIQKEDYAIIDYEGFDGEQPIDGVAGQKVAVPVGGKGFHPKFGEALIGLKKEDKGEFQIEFEKQYHNATLAGKNVTYKVKILDIKENVEPELNDEFARSFGDNFKNLEELKDKIMESMVAEKEQQNEIETKQKIIDELLKKHEFELPESLVEAEINFNVQNARQRLIASGLDFKKAGITDEKFRNDLRPISESRVKEKLILLEISTQNKFQIDDKEVEKSYSDSALNSGQPLQKIREFYSAGNRLDSLKESLLEQKTLNYLIDHAKFIEVDKADNLEEADKADADNQV